MIIIEKSGIRHNTNMKEITENALRNTIEVQKIHINFLKGMGNLNETVRQEIETNVNELVERNDERSLEAIVDYINLKLEELYEKK